MIGWLGLFTGSPVTIRSDMRHAPLGFGSSGKNEGDIFSQPFRFAHPVRRRGDLKASSIKKLEITRDKLLAHFNATTPLRGITPNEASEWRAKMLAGDAEGQGKLSEASAKHHVGNTKGFFSEAMRRGLSRRTRWSIWRAGLRRQRMTAM